MWVEVPGVHAITKGIGGYHRIDRIDGRMGEKKDVWMYGRMRERKDVWMYGRMREKKDVWMYGCMDG